MITLVLLMADLPAAAPIQRPTRVVSEAYRTAIKTYDKCLMSAAEDIAASEANRLRRYGLYARRCAVERSTVIGAWMQSNPAQNAGADGARERVEQYGWAVRRAEDRADLWAGRFLDPMPPME